jgi:signal peptidase II
LASGGFGVAMTARRNAKVASIFVFLSVVGLDQLTKWLVLRKIGLSERVGVVGPLSLVRRYNTGVAFSLGAGSAVTAWLVTAVVVALLVWVVRTISRGAQPLFALLLAAIAGGGVGNQLDRLFRNGGWNKGAVIDFIDAGLFNFAIFNVADMALTVGCALLAAWTLLGAGPDQPAARPAPSPSPRPVPTTLNEGVGSTPSLGATDRGLVSDVTVDEQAAEVSTSANNAPGSRGLPSSASHESSTKGR